MNYKLQIEKVFFELKQIKLISIGLQKKLLYFKE